METLLRLFTACIATWLIETAIEVNEASTDVVDINLVGNEVEFNITTSECSVPPFLFLYLHSQDLALHWEKMFENSARSPIPGFVITFRNQTYQMFVHVNLTTDTYNFHYQVILYGNFTDTMEPEIISESTTKFNCQETKKTWYADIPRSARLCLIVLALSLVSIVWVYTVYCFAKRYLQSKRRRKAKQEAVFSNRWNRGTSFNSETDDFGKQNTFMSEQNTQQSIDVSHSPPQHTSTPCDVTPYVNNTPSCKQRSFSAVLSDGTTKYEIDVKEIPTPDKSQAKNKGSVSVDVVENSHARDDGYVTLGRDEDWAVVKQKINYILSKDLQETAL